VARTPPAPAKGHPGQPRRRRPDQVRVVGRRVQHGRRRSTPGSFRTRVMTDGASPTLHLYDKDTKIKQNRQKGRALCTA
jgi:hypothetical protein